MIIVLLNFEFVENLDEGGFGISADAVFNPDDFLLSMSPWMGFMRSVGFIF